MEKIIIAGGSGLIGSRLVALIDTSKYEVYILTRNRKRKNGIINYIYWNPDSMEMDFDEVKNASYIINLAGAGIADKKWTPERKQLIIESRTKSTALLLKYIEHQHSAPKAYISASAIGIYGDRGDEVLTVNSKIENQNFLTESTMAWEAAIEKLKGKVQRLVVCRIGIVLSKKGGALKEILFPAKLGSLAYFGDGQQYFSWIHIDDLCQIFISAIEKETMQGVYNGVSPNPTQYKIFASKLQQVLGGLRVVHPVPKFVLKLLLGERSILLLGSAKVLPTSLIADGFEFQYSDLDEALIDLINNTK